MLFNYIHSLTVHLLNPMSVVFRQLVIRAQSLIPGIHECTRNRAMCQSKWVAKFMRGYCEKAGPWKRRKCFKLLSRPYLFSFQNLSPSFFFVFWKKKIKFLLSKLEQTTTFWRGNKIPGKKKIIWILFWKDIPSWWFISHLKWNSYRLLTCNTAIFSYFYYKLCTKFSKFIYNLRV